MNYSAGVDNYVGVFSYSVFVTYSITVQVEGINIGCPKVGRF